MRKVLLYLIIFVLICFFLPVIFTPRSEKVSKAIENKENVNEENQMTESTYDYKNYKEITLYHTETKKYRKNTIRRIFIWSCISGDASKF